MSPGVFAILEPCPRTREHVTSFLNTGRSGVGQQGDDTGGDMEGIGNGIAAFVLFLAMVAVYWIAS